MAGNMKIVKARMKTVGNIGKMTKAMKMVAASKMKKDTLRLQMGLPFCAPVIKFMQNLPVDTRAVATTIMPMGGDKGLCGGVNSSVAKACRRKVTATESAGQQANIFYVGGKQNAALKRMYKDRFVFGVDSLTAVPSNFTQACAVAHRLDELEPERIDLIHNHFVSAIAFNTEQYTLHTKKSVAAIDKLDLSKAIDQYSFEPDRVECWQDVHEFYYACSVYKGILDGNASEVSSRMSAMENASKNAASMVEKLSLKYNRARQAKITTELCEIISGASAL